MRWIGLGGALLLALGSAPRAAPDTAAPASIALPLRPGGAPTLVIASDVHIESLDPDTGKVIGSIAPIAAPGFEWRRFLRRGRFLLAEGRSDFVPEPALHTMRALVLLDDTGRVRWIETHALPRSVSRAVFIDDQGNVAFDRVDRPLLIKPDGTRVEIGQPPAGPVVHGTVDLLPLRAPGANKIEGWFSLSTSVRIDTPPDDVVRNMQLGLSVDRRRIDVVRKIDVAPEDSAYTPVFKTVGSIPSPAACRGAQQDAWPTPSPRHWILRCWSGRVDRDEREHGPSLFLVDVEARRLKRITPPATDQSDLARDRRIPDSVHATVAADGTIVATVWNQCSTMLYTAAPGGRWKATDFSPTIGPLWPMGPVCGHVTMAQGYQQSNVICPSAPVTGTYVRRPDGAWLWVPYHFAAWQSGSCSSDRTVAAFVVDGALVTARLDRAERKRVQRDVGKDLPLAWLP